MTEPLKVVVPDVVGLTSTEATKSLERVGLKVGDARLTASSETTTGNVSSTEPAGGTVVDAGTTVNLAFSSGPVRVKVPDVIGMTRSAAEAKLKSAGLAIGNDKTTPSTGATIGTVMSATPPVGALTDIGSEVRLEIADAPAKISSGPKAAGWTPQSILESIQPFVQPGLFGVLGLTVLILIVVVITQNNQDFLRELSDRDVARGLITFLIAITTVGIALILAISTLTLPEDSEGDKRFDRGKQVFRY
jgi:hypothetical protein